MCSALIWLASKSPIVEVPIASLLPGDSPRLKGESKAHARLMVDVSDMPPIIVHQPTMRVIDGAHRLAAAILRHQDTVTVRFFDGTAQDAFVIAVAANIAHGLPLSRKDRKAAVVRILSMHPDWSDRTIASTAGLSHPTVAAIRRQCSTGKTFQLNARLGRDGKARPLSSNEGREAAAELIRADRTASVREVARQAGVSVGTVHDVRARVQQGVDPLVPKARGAGLNFFLARGQAALRRLWNNPAVRFHQDGKALAQLLSRSLQLANKTESMSRSTPDYCQDGVAEVASVLGDFWNRLAQDLRAETKCG